MQKQIHTLILDSWCCFCFRGLRNDATPEVFDVKHKIGEQHMPSKFVKIGRLFAFSFVQLHNLHIRITYGLFQSHQRIDYLLNY